MKQTWWLVLLTVLAASTLWAQHHAPAPDTMQPEFANAQVRVLRLKIAPHGKIPMHQVPGHVTVWLTDAHLQVTLSDGTTQTLHFKAGEVGWTDAGQHAGENLTANPIEAILVEVHQG
jgi:quercetin dioxygenase-like cupin family protein